VRGEGERVKTWSGEKEKKRATNARDSLSFSFSFFLSLFERKEKKKRERARERRLQGRKKKDRDGVSFLFRKKRKEYGRRELHASNRKNIAPFFSIFSRLSPSLSHPLIPQSTYLSLQLLPVRPSESRNCDRESVRRRRKARECF